jgi:pimeloyl-ACP methyl ester carboxylesterase
VPIAKSGPVTIHFETSGEGDPLLLIMGLGMPGAVWIPSLALLPGFKCIYFDNRGTGISDKPDGPYTAEQMADDARAVMDAAGVRKAKVYGVSMGGMIAQELALRHPEQVEKLVLGCTFAGGPTVKLAAPEIMAKLTMGSAMLATNPDRAFDMLMPVMVPEEFIKAHPELKPMVLAAMAASGNLTPPQTVPRAIAGLASFNAYDRLSQIKCPVLIVHGDQDVLIPPENAAIMKSRLPQAEVYMIKGAGHAYPIADLAGVHNKIASWLKN